MMFNECNIFSYIIILTDRNNQPGIEINVDFEKAFDSINWKSIERRLQYFNFGNNVIKYISTIYNNIAS